MTVDPKTAANTLWMGDLESYMDDYFLTSAFQQMGEEVRNIKIIKNKSTGLSAGYCFVEFVDADAAQRCMMKLNGKIIPNSAPATRFKLNCASHGKENIIENEYSLYVGDLSDDVDDYILYYAFARRYRSCRSAKVVLEQNGHSKGYGFVRFTEDADQQRALVEMQHMTGIGRKPIRVSMATPKMARSYLEPSSSMAPDSHGYYGGYYGSPYYPYYPQSGYYSSYYGQPPGQPYTDPRESMPNYNEPSLPPEDDVLEEPELEVDVQRLNRDFMYETDEVFEAIDESRWFPLNSITSKLPTASVKS
ncbi:hypothetical protein ScPMuIL_000385 [Solemya velum]